MSSEINKQETVKTDENKDLFSKLNSYFNKRQKPVFIVSVILTVVFGLLLFDPKVSAGGDDSSYILKAFWFIKKFNFPTFQGPLYPILLSPFILIFGVNVTILKGLSLIFILGHLYFFHITFKNKIPGFLHVSILIILSVSSSYLYFSYQTYVEAFYLFVQSLGIWYFVKTFVDNDENEFNLKKDYKKYLYTGLFILLAGLTRSVGYAMLGVIIMYFIFYKKWKHILPVTGSFGLFYIIYSVLKKIIWGISGSDFQSQGSGLIYKNYYNHAEGKEDLAGFFQRLIDNSQLYLSKHLYVFLGLREKIVGMKPVGWLTIITILLFAVSLILLYKRNKHAFLASLYSGALCFITFIMVQKSWDQDRLIIPYFPLIMVSLFSGLYFLLKFNQLKKLQFLLPILIIIIIFSSFTTSVKLSKENSKLKGPWYDLTPDWVNYIKCSRWAAKNVPEEANIASRKPSISFIYSKGREFTGLYSFNTLNTNEVFMGLPDSLYIVVSYNNIFNKEIPPQLQFLCRQNMAFILNNNGQLTGVFNPKDAQKEYILQNLKKLSVDYSLSPRDFISEKQGNLSNSYTVSPDSLVNYFRKRDINYVIKASLRINPYVKTNRTINTVERYLVFIEQKYPGIFEKIIQMGDDNNEPASLYYINYSKYNL